MLYKKKNYTSNHLLETVAIIKLSPQARKVTSHFLHSKHTHRKYQGIL